MDRGKLPWINPATSMIDGSGDLRFRAGRILQSAPPRSIHPSPSIKSPILLINRVLGSVLALKQRPGRSSCFQTIGQLKAKQGMWIAGAHLNYILREVATFLDEPAPEDAIGAAKDGPRCVIGKREPLKLGGTYLERLPCSADVLTPSHRTYA